MMYWHDQGMGGVGYLLMVINMVLFWALVIGGVVVGARYLARIGNRPVSPGEQASTAMPGPEQILADRFARGEIDEDDYRRRLDTLRGGGRPASPA